MSKRRSNSGYTMIEMILALIIGFIVVLALGKLILVNQSAWEWGRDKVVLQQNVTEALEWMARSVRAARVVIVGGSDDFSTYDESGALKHTYQLVTAGSDARLQEDGSDLVDRNCTLFTVEANPDSTSLTLTLELEDNSGNLVAGMTRVTVRNRTLEF